MNRTSFIAAIMLLALVSVGGSSCSSGSGGSGSSVTVTFAPANAATSVTLSISTAVTATFSAAITEPADWAGASTLIAEGASATSCTAVTYDVTSRTATCTHGLLTGETDYTMSVAVTDSGGAAVTGTATFTTTAASAWTVEDGTRVENRTSSSTIVMADGSFMMFLAGVMASMSTDGVTFPEPAFVTGAQDMSANVAILHHSTGLYLLLTEVQGGDNIKRFMRYVSTDAQTFTQTPGSGENGSVFEPTESDAGFISVPDMIELPDGSIRLYYVAGGDHTESATSTDKGQTWTREGSITIDGIPSGYWIVDPDIVELDDGRYRLFFATKYDEATDSEGQLRIRSALSLDGRSFTLEANECLGIGGDVSLRIDPDVVLLSDGSYRMYFGEQGTSGPGNNLRSAVSAD